MPPQVRDDNPSRTRKVKREAVKGEADASPTPGAQRTAAKRGAAGEAAAAPRHRQKLDGAGGGGGGSGVQAAATATASTTTAPGEAAAAARKPAPPPAPPSIWATPASAPLTAEGGGEGGGAAASSAGDAQAGGEAGEAGGADLVEAGEAYGGGARAPWHAKIRAAFLVGVGEDAFELFEVARRLKPGAPLSALSAAGAEMLGPLRMLGGGGGGSVGGAVGGAAGGAVLAYFVEGDSGGELRLLSCADANCTAPHVSTGARGAAGFGRDASVAFAPGALLVTLLDLQGADSPLRMAARLAVFRPGSMHARDAQRQAAMS